MSAFADIESLYDVKGVCDAITKFGFDIVVLQFPDENLADATNVYTAIKGSIRDSIELYITADSTYGSSVDDVSALHVHCKLLVYFGSDMSVSGSMPVLVCPKRLHIDTAKAADVIAAEVSTAIAGGEDAVSVLVFLEPAYFNCLDAVQASVTTAVASHRVTVAFGSRPACVDLTTWDPANTRNTEAIATHELIGGMLVPRDRTISEKDLVVIIGDKNDQIINICLRYSGSKIICYSPSANACSTKLGVELKEYRERYLGVMRVQDASVIGLIIGSMGLSGDVIQSTVNGLKKLVKAAGKKSYVLVMGRLNEAKLRNFPEVATTYAMAVTFHALIVLCLQIDMFCLVSNDDTSLISPKYRQLCTSTALVFLFFNRFCLQDLSYSCYHTFRARARAGREGVGQHIRGGRIRG